MDKIVLRNLHFMASHGVTEQERALLQPFRVTIKLSIDLAAAAASDDLTKTLDYGQYYLKVKEIVEGESFNLLETLAGRIAEMSLLQPGVSKAKVEVEKTAAKVGDIEFGAAVVIERSSD